MGNVFMSNRKEISSWVGCGIHETSFQRAWRIKRLPQCIKLCSLYMNIKFID